MSIYKKIQVVKKKLLEANLKKTGENKFSNFKYYELADFTPNIINFCNEVGLFTKFSYNNETATLTIVNCDKPEQTEEYTSPMRTLQLKGCNDIQALGGVETYSRRYLYMSAFDIIENDMFDAVSGKEEPIKQTKQDTKPVTKETPALIPTQKPVTKATPEQVARIIGLYSNEEIKQALELVKKEKLEDLTLLEANSLISKRSESK